MDKVLRGPEPGKPPRGSRCSQGISAEAGHIEKEASVVLLCAMFLIVYPEFYRENQAISLKANTLQPA